MEQNRYRICRGTLQNKLHGAYSKNPGHPTLLSEAEEALFEEMLVSLSAYGFPLDILDLRLVVKAYLDRKGVTMKQIPDNTPGVDWQKIL